MNEEELNKLFHRIELDKSSDSCGFEFADGFDCTFDNIATCYDDRLKLYELVKDLRQENQSLKKQLEYLRSGEYYNQLRFERDTLQYVADNGKVSKEDKAFIDMTHRNTELLEVIEEVREEVKKSSLEVNTREYGMLTVCNSDDLLQILDKAKENKQYS